MPAKRKTRWLWALWGALTLAVLGFAGVTMAYGGPRHLFLIGQTTNAHHQIELACNSCHTSWFGGREAIETACQSCHSEDLTNSKDNHPAKKFNDPRNADRLAKLDATKCLTCHIEHRPEVTNVMAVTKPMDFCVACHDDIADERISHKGLGFQTCGNAGCHNFHDNRSLYEDFLEKHLDEPAVKSAARITLVNWQASDMAGGKAIAATIPDAPSSVSAEAHVMADWLGSAHANGGVNCSGCHQPAGAKADDARSWIAKPGMAQCAGCHTTETKGFTQGKHGMRLADGMWTSRKALFGLISDQTLSPMRPELARLPMKAKAHGKELVCTTCHQAHDFNVQKAKVEACASCHDDKHSNAYFASSHHRLWKDELAGKAPKGSGVTCATCHMPRTLQRGEDGVERALVNHNQNDNLRPNEKMARTVCMECHGLGYTLDALADPGLIDRNFKGRPSVHVESIDWVRRRVRQRGETP
jgi:predicted CXXCH cytochrome family protein